MKLLLKNPAPGTFGIGNRFISLVATGSKHERLMILLTASTHPAGTNGLLATMLPVSSLRLPVRISAVGTVAVCDSARSVRDDW